MTVEPHKTITVIAQNNNSYHTQKQEHSSHKTMTVTTHKTITNYHTQNNNGSPRTDIVAPQKISESGKHHLTFNAI
jgi:hypothetical protein